MAHNIFHTGTEWLSDNVIDPVTNYATDLYVDYKINDMVDSFKDEFKGPTTITPDMADAGWKYGIDGVPYNSSIAMFPEDFETDSNVTPRPGNIGPDFAANNTVTTSSPFLSQDLRQRTPSGTIYNPSMEAFDNASLFNYEGPGGVAEYTYGQGLPIDYGVYGTPPGPNLYYEGQFGEGFVEPGVADTAITLPPVTMPDGVPQIPPSNNNTNTNTSTSNGGNDLTYAETIAAMGIAPGDAPSTLFPGTGTEVSSTKQANMPGFNGMNPDFLVSQADQGPDIGLPNYTNNGTISAADQARFDNARMERFSPTGGPSIYDTMTSPTMIGGEEQVFEGSYEMNPNDDGAFAYGGSQSNQGNFETANQMVGGSLPTNIIRNPNEETQQYRGIFVDPRTVPEINDVEARQTFMPSFPANYGEGVNIQTVTDVPYMLDMPIGDNLVGNEIPGRPGELSAFSENDAGMVDARRNFLFNNNLDLGRPGDASYVDFEPSAITDAPITSEDIGSFVMDIDDIITQKDFDKMRGQQEARDRLNASTVTSRLPSGFMSHPNPSEARVQDYITRTPELVKKEVQFPITRNEAGGFKPQPIIKQPTFNNIITPSGKTRADSGMSIFSAMPVWMGGF